MFFAMISVTGLMMAAIIAERARAEAERDELIRQQAAAQAREEAEKEAALLRDELAHLGRVEMLNALSAAIAHEDQPAAGGHPGERRDRDLLLAKPPVSCSSSARC